MGCGWVGVRTWTGSKSNLYCMLPPNCFASASNFRHFEAFLFYGAVRCIDLNTETIKNSRLKPKTGLEALH